MDTHALRLSLELAALTTAGLLVLGIPLAQWLATTRFRGRPIAEAIVSLPLVLPPTVLGYYLLVAFGARSPLGQAWTRLTGRPLAFSFTGLLVASLVYSLPFAVQPFAASFAAVDPRLLAASATLGASAWRTFCRVILPLSLSGLVTGVALSFAHTVGEFGVVLMIGGNIPGVTRTVSIDIYDSVQAAEFGAAGRTALVLLLFSFVVLSVVYALNRKVWAVWPFR
jgi:molybdate transport system permease protein